MSLIDKYEFAYLVPYSVIEKGEQSRCKRHRQRTLLLASFELSPEWSQQKLRRDRKALEYDTRAESENRGRCYIKLSISIKPNTQSSIVSNRFCDAQRKAKQVFREMVHSQSVEFVGCSPEFF